MESHKCRLFIKGKLFDDQAECAFENISKKRILYEGEVFSQKSLMKFCISGESDLEMQLDDGRKGIIVITNVTTDDSRRGEFRIASPLK